MKTRIGLLRLLWDVKVLPLVLIVITICLLVTGMYWVHWNETYIDVNVIGKHIDYSKSDSGTQSHYVGSIRS